VVAAPPPWNTLSRGFIAASSAISCRRVAGSARRRFCSAIGSLRSSRQAGSTSNGR
jgi:hypothetical protein